MSAKKLIRVSMRTLKKLQDPYYQGSAAELGFFFIFSVVPILTLLLQATSYSDLTSQLLDHLVSRFSDNAMVISLISSVRSSLSGGFSILFAIIALWSASKIEFSLIRIANYTYDLGNNGNQLLSYIKLRLRAIVTIAGLILLIFGSLLILVYGQTLAELLNMLLVRSLQLKLNTSWLFNILRWPIALIIYVFFLMINYQLLPNRHMSLRDFIPGSIFTSAGIIVATIFYFIYFQHFSNMDLVYGSLTAIIALLLWFYWIGYILVVGMIINAAVYEEKSGDELW